MNLKFSIVAEREIENAADYYEKQEAGLGLRFVHELDHAIKFILQFPNAWVARFEASSAVRAARLSLHCHLFRPTGHRHDRNGGSSASRPGEVANAAQRTRALESEAELRDLYGEIGYTIIDDVLTLTERLPGIYRRLTT